jgi:hypothetical protein
MVVKAVPATFVVEPVVETTTGLPARLFADCSVAGFERITFEATVVLL